MHRIMQELRARAREERLEWDEQQRKHEEEYLVGEGRKNRELVPKLRRAKPRDYRKWLKGYLGLGGDLTHFYDYTLPASWFVARKDLTIFALYGSQAIQIIVPGDIEVEVEALGHNGLYFMKDFTKMGSWVPVYADTIV